MAVADERVACRPVPPAIIPTTRALPLFPSLFPPLSVGGTFIPLYPIGHKQEINYRKLFSAFLNKALDELFGVDF